MRLVFLGAPGVGKGTQADRMAAQFGAKKISTGDLLRDAVRRGTQLGIEAKGYMDQGKLVPDSVVIGLVRDKLVDPEYAKGFILDGFPRTVHQAEELEKVLRERGMPLDRVVNFQVSREAIVKRLSGRRSCPKCQATFHVEFAPSRNGEACDRCQERLVQRNDDKAEAIETRLKVYEEQTAPLISFYDKRQVLTQLDAGGPVETVSQNLTKMLATHKMA